MNSNLYYYWAIKERDIINDDYYDDEYEPDDYIEPTSTFDGSEYEKDYPLELQSGKNNYWLHKEQRLPLDNAAWHFLSYSKYAVFASSEESKEWPKMYDMYALAQSNFTVKPF